MGRKRITHKYFFFQKSQRKLCSFKIIFPIFQFVMENHSVLDHELLVELLSNGSDWFLAMTVAVIDHTIGKQHSVMAMAWTTTLTLHHEVATKIDGPTKRVKLQPPQMVLTVTVEGDMAAFDALAAHSLYHLGGVCALVLVALHQLLQMLQRGVEEAGKGHRPAVEGSQLRVVGDVLAIG